MGAESYADAEIREQPHAPWRLVAELYLGRGSRLWDLLFPEDPEDFSAPIPKLKTAWGLPPDFHRCVELQCALDRVRARARTEDLGSAWLSGQEDILTARIVNRFDPSHEELRCWTTLDALEHYRPHVAFDPMSDPVPRRLSDAISLLKAAGEGENARLVICRFG